MAVMERDIRKKPIVKWTLDQFLSFEEWAQVKHQLIAGRVYEMAGGTGEHSEISVNCLVEAQVRLRGSNCRAYNSDMLIKVDAHNAVYADVCVVCGTPIYDDSRHLALLNPIFVVEVTSPSSMRADRGWKLDMYQSLPSVRAVLIVDQHRVHADLRTRGGDGWEVQVYAALDEAVPLPDLGIELPLAEVYRGVQVA